MPAVAVVFDRLYPFGDEGRVVSELLRELGVRVPEKVYTTVQPGIMGSNRAMLPGICALAFGAGYDQSSLQVTPFTLSDQSHGVVVYHP